MDSEATAADDGTFGGGSFGGAPRPIGAILGAARVARGIELTDIARDTRVPVRHLAAIEADDHDHLPALPYAIGFVKAFARAVGVDPEMAGAHFRAETNKAAHVPVAPAMTPLDERRLPPRGLVAASVAALVVVIALVAAWSAGAFDPAPPAAPVAVAAAPTAPSAVPPETAAAPAGNTTAAPGNTTALYGDTTGAPGTTTSAPGTTAATPAAVPAPSPTTSAATPPAAAPLAVAGTAGSVVITAREDAWFRVSVYDAAAHKVVTVKTGVLAKGERYVPPPTPGLRLWTGRAGALQIAVDGRALPPLGGPVETVKNVSLDASDLRARLAAPAPLPGRAGPPVG